MYVCLSVFQFVRNETGPPMKSYITIEVLSLSLIDHLSPSADYRQFPPVRARNLKKINLTNQNLYKSDENFFRLLLLLKNNKRYMFKTLIYNCFKYVVACHQNYFSLPVIHKVGNVGIFVLLKFGNKIDTMINHFNFNSKHHDTYNFSLEVVHKRQHCHYRKFNCVSLCNSMPLVRRGLTIFKFKCS